MHIALLGDSTLDNAPYTEGGPDVVAHLNALLHGSDRATLLAQDGAVIASVELQVRALRELLEDGEEDDPPTHVVLSVGGNDLLGEVDVLGAPARSVGEGLLQLRERAERFGSDYRGMLDRVLSLELPTVVCTVYHGAFPDPTEARIVDTALRVFDHEILEAGVDRGVPVIDLRRVCSAPEDYWNPIEPSERGGAKIAAAIAGALRAPR